MARFALSSLRARLVLLVLFAIIPALALIVSTVSEERRQMTEQLRKDVRRLTWLAAAHEEELIGQTRQLLLALSHMPEIQSTDGGNCSARLTHLLGHYDRYADLGAIKPNGDIYCSAVPLTRPLNVADRPFFQLAIKTGDFVLGDYLRDPTSGKRIVTIAFPALEDGGQLTAVLYAGLDLTWLNRVESEIRDRLPRDSTITKVDDHGVVIAHQPEPERMVGRPVGASLFKTVTTRGTGTVEAPGVDGVSRLYGFRPVRSGLRGGKIYEILGVPEARAFGEISRRLARNLAGLGITAALAMAAAWFGGDVFIRRPVNALLGATRRMTAGDLGARTGQRHGAGELGELAHAFDGMAAQLQAKVADLEGRTRELALLRDVDRGILAGTPIAELVRPVLQELAGLAGAESCVFVVADREDGSLRPLATHGESPEKVSGFFEESHLRVGEGMVGLAISSRAPAASPDVAADARWERLQDAVLARGVRAAVAVPLVAGEEVLGAISLNYPAPRPFPEEELHTLKLFADQLAIALQQAYLREAAAERFRLQEASRVKSLFLASMSHEIRTPLTSILGFTEMLQGGSPGPLNEKQHRYLGHIDQAGKHLLHLINDFLDLSKAEAGQFTLSPEAVPLAPTLEAALVIVRGPAAKKQVRLTLQVAEGLGTVWADPIRLKQMLYNLLSNAVKFTPEGGQVTLTARRADARVEIAVRDTGIGIRAEDLPRLFTEFSQLGPRRHEGTGLGLALTKRLVELHKGSIRVESAPGVGSTFTLMLPERDPANEDLSRGTAGSPAPAESPPDAV